MEERKSKRRLAYEKGRREALSRLREDARQHAIRLTRLAELAGTQSVIRDELIAAAEFCARVWRDSEGMK